MKYCQKDKETEKNKIQREKKLLSYVCISKKKKKNEREWKMKKEKDFVYRKEENEKENDSIDRKGEK